MESPISTMLSGQQEPLSNQTTSRPSVASDDKKAKMRNNETDHSDTSDGVEFSHLVDSEFNVSIIKTPGVKKPLQVQMRNVDV